MFGKRNKEEVKAPPSVPEESRDGLRESILSAWAVEPLLRPQGAADSAAGKSREENRGFVICRKCFEVIPAKEMKCPNCGAANSRG